MREHFTQVCHSLQLVLSVLNLLRVISTRRAITCPSASALQGRPWREEDCRNCCRTLIGAQVQAKLVFFLARWISRLLHKRASSHPMSLSLPFWARWPENELFLFGRNGKKRMIKGCLYKARYYQAPAVQAGLIKQYEDDNPMATDPAGPGRGSFDRRLAWPTSLCPATWWRKELGRWWNFTDDIHWMWELP